MIGAVLGFLTRLPLQAVIGLVVAGVLALAGSAAGLYVWADHNGFARSDLQWKAKWALMEYDVTRAAAAEMQRQDDANVAARQIEQAELADLDNQLAAQASLVSQLQDQAASDPAGGNVALDAAAVARHNRRTGH